MESDAVLSDNTAMSSYCCQIKNYRPNKFAQFAASCRLSALFSFAVITPRVEGGHDIVSERKTQATVGGSVFALARGHSRE